MAGINWNLADNGNSFQNALAQGFQMGDMMRQRREEGERRNALAAYATDPSEQNFAGLAQAAPEYAIRERDRMAASQAQQQERRQADMGTFRQLLKRAAQSPEGWQQALGAAQQLGLDVSQVPQQFDPAWAQQQMFIMDALETPEGKEALSTAGKQAVDMGFQPGTPEFQAKVTEIWQQNGAIPYTDASGATRLYMPGRTTQTGPEPGSVVGGYRFRGGNPNDQNSWEQVGGAGSNASGGFPGN